MRLQVRTSEIDEKLLYSTVKSVRESNSGDKTVRQLDDPPHHDQSDHSTIVELLVNGEGLDSKIGVLQHNGGASNQDFAESFLEDVFGTSLTMNGGGLSKLIEVNCLHGLLLFIIVCLLTVI